jgi:hypothetical protein
MIEKHYSHLKVIQAIEQLRGEETRRLIAQTHTTDDMYKSVNANKPKKTPKKAKVVK